MNQLPARYKEEKEGQFLERKSCFNKRAKTPKPLPLMKVSGGIAETLVAFANADGGELVVGLDDDGTPSGLPFSEKQLIKLLENAIINSINESGEGHYRAKIKMDSDVLFKGRICRAQFGSERTLEYEEGQGCLFDWGYALTVHKAQGSEASIEAVILEAKKNGKTARKFDRQEGYALN